MGQVVALCWENGLKPGRGSTGVDANGLGVGVASGLKSQGFTVDYFRGSMRAPGKLSDEHENIRAASFMNLRDLLREDRIDLPRDPLTTLQANGPRTSDPLSLPP